MCGRQWVLLASLALACGNDEDVGGSSDPQTTDPPSDSTTSTGVVPTTSDSDSNTLTEATQSTSDDTTSDGESTMVTPPDPLALECGEPPDGAVEATYKHQPDVTGGNPGYVFTADGLPGGLTIDPASGQITGEPLTPGDYVVTLHVTDDDDTTLDVECPPFTINDKLHVDLDSLPGPCLLEGESILQYVSGGDGSEIVCATPKGVGDGDVPQGITVDAATCEIVGAIEETRFGTWAWIVRARQSGVDAYAPYCATQSVQGPDAYAITADHSGGMDNQLAPLEATFDPNAALKVDTDPKFEIDKGMCGQSCFFGFFYKVSPSPLGTGACLMDKDKCTGLCPLIDDPNEPDGDKQIGCSLLPQMMNPKTGFAHELWAKGDTPSAEFADRPFVQQWSIDYCLSSVQSDCSTKDGILANGDGTNLEFAVILRPQP